MIRRIVISKDQIQILQNIILYQNCSKKEKKHAEINEKDLTVSYGRTDGLTLNVENFVFKNTLLIIYIKES